MQKDFLDKKYFIDFATDEKKETLLFAEKKAVKMAEIAEVINPECISIIEKVPIHPSLQKTFKVKLAFLIKEIASLSISQWLAENSLTKEERDGIEKSIAISKELNETSMEKYIK